MDASFVPVKQTGANEAQAADNCRRHMQTELVEPPAAAAAVVAGQREQAIEKIPYNRSIENNVVVATGPSSVVVDDDDDDDGRLGVSSAEYIKHDNQRIIPSESSTDVTRESIITHTQHDDTRQTTTTTTTTKQPFSLADYLARSNNPSSLPNPVIVHPVLSKGPPRRQNSDQGENNNNDTSSKNNNNKNNNKSSTDISHTTNTCSMRSASSPQLTIKPLTRSKVYRKASLKSTVSSSSYSSSARSSFSSDHKIKTLSSQSRIINISNRNIPPNSPVEKNREQQSSGKEDLSDGQTEVKEVVEEDEEEAKRKWNVDEVRITCNPLSSTPYPYSAAAIQKNDKATTEQTEEAEQQQQPKGRTCGNFLPILSLIPQTVISFQYLSPKMKFSWWRNKIS